MPKVGVGVRVSERGDLQRNQEVEQKARRWIGPSAFFRTSSDNYLEEAANALDLPSSGTIPSCCMRPKLSQLTKPSNILPFVNRAMLTPVMLNCLPVGAMPFSSPLWVPRQDQRATTVSPSASRSSIVKRMSGKALR